MGIDMVIFLLFRFVSEVFGCFEIKTKPPKQTSCAYTSFGFIFGYIKTKLVSQDTLVGGNAKQKLVGQSPNEPVLIGQGTREIISNAELEPAKQLVARLRTCHLQKRELVSVWNGSKTR